MGGVTYHTGALVAAERNNRQMWALHAGYLAEEVIPTVPAPVLAGAWRGGSRQASLSRLLRMCDTEPMSDELARNVGLLAGKSGHDDIVDVSVVEGAGVVSWIERIGPTWACDRPAKSSAFWRAASTAARTAAVLYDSRRVDCHNVLADPPPARTEFVSRGRTCPIWGIPTEAGDRALLAALTL